MKIHQEPQRQILCSLIRYCFEMIHTVQLVQWELHRYLRNSFYNKYAFKFWFWITKFLICSVHIGTVSIFLNSAFFGGRQNRIVRKKPHCAKKTALICSYRDWCKKNYWPRNWPIINNPQFLPNQADIQAIFPSH